MILTMIYLLILSVLEGSDQGINKREHIKTVMVVLLSTTGTTKRWGAVSGFTWVSRG